MNLFFDTSALIKFFHEEKGSEEVVKLILDSKNNIYLSELAKVEFKSALFRRYRRNEINTQLLELAIENFNKAISNFHIIQVESVLISDSEKLLIQFGKKEGLRTLDALQLASFLMVKSTNWKFVVSDVNLRNIAKSMKINCLFI